MIDTNWAIDLSGVDKTYGKKIHALRGVDMRVGRGEIFGLLGPNGAGKSTLVKIMMTIVLPDEAEGTILGEPLGHRPTLAKIGYLPEGHRFAPYLTAAQTLKFFGQLSNVPPGDLAKRADGWMRRLGMARWINTKVGQYSKGMMQRLGMVQALIHEPELVVLDEPTDGVDPIGRRDIREILLELKSQGKTVFVNSHILSELELVCDRVAILVEGQVARQGSIDELTAHTRVYKITTTEPLDEIKAQLQDKGVTVDGTEISIKHTDAAGANDILDLLRSNGFTVLTMMPTRWSLEQVFIDAASALKQEQS